MKRDGHHNKVQIHFKPAHHQHYTNTNKSSVIALVMMMLPFRNLGNLINNGNINLDTSLTYVVFSAISHDVFNHTVKFYTLDTLGQYQLSYKQL
jgi:hypothetical protein